MTGPSYPARINPGIIRNPPTRTTPADNVVFPRKNVKLIPTATSNIKRFRLLEISHWPETKTEIEHSHADLPWGGQACMDLPHLYSNCSASLVADRLMSRRDVSCGGEGPRVWIWGAS
jgi:hypothetical protein